MSEWLDPSLLQRLRGSKLRVRTAQASSGLGERRSRQIGPGIEFAEYREYQPGDDRRHVDRHVFARHGRAVVRRFVVDQQLRATVLIDCSESMRGKDGDKWIRARALGAAVAAIAVFGGDQVRLAAVRGGSVDLQPLIRSSRGLPRALAWLEGLRTGGSVELVKVARAVSRAVAPGELLVMVSDWLLEGAEAALPLLSAAQLELVAVQVVSPEDSSAAALAGGAVRLLDVETAAVLDVTIDKQGARRYDRAFQEWQAEHRELLTRHGGLWLASSTGVPLEDVVLGSWRREGFVV